DLIVVAHHCALPVVVRAITIALKIDDILGFALVLTEHHHARRAGAGERKRDGRPHGDGFGLALVGFDEADAVPIVFAGAFAGARAFEVRRQLLAGIFALVEVDHGSDVRAARAV